MPARWRALVPARAFAEADLLRAIVQARFSKDRRASKRHRGDFYRGMWTQAAEAVGAAVRPAGDDALDIDLGATVIRVRETSSSIDSPEVLARAGDKPGVHRLLAEIGLPLPAYETFTLGTLARAEAFVAGSPVNCVVKPARDTGGGRGVTTGIRRTADLHRAAASAAAQGARASAGPGGGQFARLRRMRALLGGIELMIEAQVPGENYRLLYLDGQLLDIVRRGAPTVSGDGHSRIGDLIDRLNEERLRAGGQRGQWLVSRDLDLERTLDAQGLSLASVPGAGESVRLKTVVNENDPQNNHPARSEVCERIVEQGARAAAAVGARLAGVDIITPDASIPLEESGGRILEVNTTPGFAIHLNGKPGAVDPATMVLRHVSASPSPRSRS